MAKNRRKERDGQGAEGTRKRRKVLVPEDTNAEVLPARSQVVQNEVSVEVVSTQFSSSGQWLTWTDTKRAKETYWEEEKKI